MQTEWMWTESETHTHAGTDAKRWKAGAIRDRKGARDIRRYHERVFELLPDLAAQRNEMGHDGDAERLALQARMKSQQAALSRRLRQTELRHRLFS